jgi:hypothetical protein
MATAAHVPVRQSLEAGELNGSYLLTLDVASGGKRHWRAKNNGEIGGDRFRYEPTS